MLSVDLLAEPIKLALRAFGSGSPGEELLLTGVSLATKAIATVDKAAPEVLRLLADTWEGPAAQAAERQTAELRQSTDALRQQDTELDRTINVAASLVAEGYLELGEILGSFLSQAGALLPSVTTPVGQAALIKVATEHVLRALVAVERTAHDLQGPTARMAELAAGQPEIPAGTSLPAAQQSGGQALALPAGSGGDGTQQYSAAASTTGSGGGVYGSGAGTAVPGYASYSGGANGWSAPAGGYGGGGGLSADGGAVGYASPASSGSGSVATAEGIPPGGGEEFTLPDGTVVTAPNEQAARAVQNALSALGTPYVWGGNTPGVGLDCSGLTQWAYGQAGVDIPRLAQEQHLGTAAVAPDALLPGDLVVWSGHVAMVIGNGQMVEAGDPVQVSAIRTTNSGQEFYGFYRPTQAG